MRGPGRPGQGGSGPPRTQHMGHEARLSAWHPNLGENWSRHTQLVAEGLERRLPLQTHWVGTMG